MVNQYTLQDAINIIFNGFEIQIPEETIKFIGELTSQVGSPTYIKTPNFQKKEVVIDGNSNSNSNSNSIMNGRRKRRGTMESVKDGDWENLRSFHATKMEQKIGLDVEIDMIRSYLNKMSNKTYEDMKNHITDILDKLIDDGISDEDILRVSGFVFDIASNNRFFSKLYADLYSVLMNKYDIMQDIFENSIAKFMELFSVIESADPEKDYDKFCKINKDNEMRKSLSAFFVNLCTIHVLSIDKIINLIVIMMSQVNEYIHQDNKKSEVDEFTENIAILYDSGLISQIHLSNVLIANNMTIKETIEMLASCKAKDYKSLSNKSIFKYMDLVERF